MVGEGGLRVISPEVLELSLITTAAKGERPGEWDFATAEGAARIPAPTALRVLAGGREIAVREVGYRRRAVYAPIKPRDLRIGNWLYLRLAAPVREGAGVEVINPDGRLWPASRRFTAVAERMRESPAIHVNQVSYAPDLPKRAFVGCYLGSLGELDIAAGPFSLIDATTNRAVFSGTLKLRPDRGWTYPTAPYQRVLEADFSAFRTPGVYRLLVPGLGASLPFRIDEGTPAAFARAYALGLYHQRCGTANELTFTRFVHQPCHTAPAEVPTEANKSVARKLAGESSNYRDNPRHTAPQLKSVSASLYPFVRQGPVDVSGGHHDAGDYSKYTINSAALVHALVFAADAFPGVGALDNLGIPESGDGKSDILQEAKWEADFLLKMQDEDGGFYFLVYPRGRAYESDVLPDHGDPQVVFPKTTSVTAAATAALAQCASSPRFKREFPDAAGRYLAAAKRGWQFLERAWEKYGMDGSYQKITHYGDFAMHYDEIAWAACELFLATGEQKYHDRLRSTYDPADPPTRHWTWERLFDAYGNACRSYAFAARTGRVAEGKLDAAYLAKCRAEVIAGGKDHADWSAACAYGTSFPTESKRFRSAGWYFATAQAFDIAVACLLEPRAEWLDAIVSNLNYEAGSNPVNVCFLTGLGWRRQHEIVHHYSVNDRRSLPPSGIPLGSIQQGFMYLDAYGKDLGALSFPPDGAADRAYPMYDRWGDSFNVTTEFTIPLQGRGLAVTAWLMARSPLAAQPWRTAAATIRRAPTNASSGGPMLLTLNASGLDLAKARIVWESDQGAPVIGNGYRYMPAGAAPHWVEAEAQLPDGRRVSAALEISAGARPVSASGTRPGRGHIARRVGSP